MDSLYLNRFTIAPPGYWLLVFAAFAPAFLNGCDQAGAQGGSSAGIVGGGPPVSISDPAYVLQLDDRPLRDDGGQPLAYANPVVAGVALERLAAGNPEGRYSVVLQGGSVVLSYGEPGQEWVLQPMDVRVDQNGGAGSALEAALEPGMATFGIAVSGGTTVEWYLNGARVAEGNPISIDLTEGDHLLTVMLWSDGGSTTSMDIPLSVAQPLAEVLLSWDIPIARENGDPLPVAELCCYQVTIIAANTLSIVEVTGGTTTAVQLELRPAIYLFSIVAIDSDGLTSAPSDTVEADLT